jgi:single-strand DNA-binding protein
MASDINMTVFTGRVVKDPEMRGSADNPVASFSIAINRSVRQKDGTWTDGVDFVDVSCFNGLAKLVLKKLRKADRVTIHGRLAQHTWEAEGQKRSKLGVIGNQVVGEYAYRTAESTHDPETYNASIDNTLQADEQVEAVA